MRKIVCTRIKVNSMHVLCYWSALFGKPVEVARMPCKSLFNQEDGDYTLCLIEKM